MLSLVLTLSLGQASLSPPLTAPPLGVDAPLEPIRIEGPPALVRGVGQTNVQALWLDRRRSLDQLDAGLDVWVGTYDVNRGVMNAALLTRNPRQCSQPRLVSEPVTTLLAMWTCVPPGGGGVIEATSAPTRSFSQLQPTTIVAMTAAPILELAAATSPTATMVVARSANSLSIFRPRPAFTAPVVLPAAFGSASIVETPDGGLNVLLVDAARTVRSYDSATGVQVTGLATDATAVTGLHGQPEWSFVYRTDGADVRRRLADGGDASFGVSLVSGPLLSMQAGSNTLTVVRGTNNNIDLRVLDVNSQLRGFSSPDSGIPISIARSTSSPILIAQLLGGEVMLRDINLTGMTPSFGAVHQAFRAPAPQLSASGGWSANDLGFITLWDQRAGTSWQTRAALVDNGGAQELAPVQTEITAGKPSITRGPDGGLFVALDAPGGRQIFELIGGSLGTSISPSALDEIVIGQSSWFTWSPRTNIALHSAWGGLSVIDPVRPGCVAWWEGSYWYAPVNGRSIAGIAEDGGSVTTTANLPMPPPQPFERCLTISETGAMRLTTTTFDGLEVFDLDAGRLLATKARVEPVGPAAIVGVADGVVAVVPSTTDGGQPTLSWVYAGPLISTVNTLDNGTQPVRNVRAARSPQGDVLASWETFELDAGAWRVQMRIIQGPYPTIADEDGGLDAGSPDAGALDAGPLDAGPGDAGAPDAGPLDAGPLDAGPGDAGAPDAGPPDAGAPDAGPPDAGSLDAGPDGGMEQVVNFVPVCGCSGAGGLPGLLAGLVLLLRRLRGLR